MSLKKINLRSYRIVYKFSKSIEIYKVITKLQKGYFLEHGDVKH